MKNTMKIFLVIALLSSVALADGDMGTGGFTGDMGTGGKTCPQGQTCLLSADESKESVTEGSADSIFEIVRAYLDSIFETSTR